MHRVATMSLQVTALCFLLLTCSNSWAQETINVATSTGLMQGHLVQLPDSQLEVYEFLGVPYAEPPIGPLRFQRPQEKKAWPGVLKADRAPAMCPQMSLIGSQVQGQEDCLHLNIWVPKQVMLRSRAERERNPAAVMLWIHGGAFSIGSASESVTSGLFLAGYNDVIVVALQYRLGPFGWLYLPDEQAGGNQGLWDQQLAMRWLCENAATLSGSCQRVTLFGESAGAASASHHLLTRDSRRFFQRAALQSGSSASRWSVGTPQRVGNFSRLLLRLTNCSSVQCLQAVPAEQLVRLQESSEWPSDSITFGPVMDGDFFEDYPDQLIDRGQFFPAPLLLGFNRNEGVLFLPDSGLDLFLKWNSAFLNQPAQLSLYNRTALKLIALCRDSDPAVCRGELEAVKMLYSPLGQRNLTNMDVLAALDAAGTDGMFACPSYRQAAAWAGVGSSAYVYHFTHRPSVSFFPQWAGVAHTEDLGFVFGEPLNFGSKAYTDREVILARKVMAYWSNFAKNGDPNGSGLPRWPEFSQDSQQVLEIREGMNDQQSVSSSLKAKQCQFWNGYLPQLKQQLRSARSVDADGEERCQRNAGLQATKGQDFLRLLLSLWFCTLLLAI